MLDVLPKWVQEEQKDTHEFLKYITGKALVKMQEYRKKDQVFRSKYKKEFEEFEKDVLSLQKEDFTLWDDYIEWKAFHSAYKMWEERYRSIIDA